MDKLSSVCFVCPVLFWEKNDGAKTVVSSAITNFPADAKHVIVTKNIKLDPEKVESIKREYGLASFQYGLPLSVFIKKAIMNVLYLLHLPIPYSLMKPVHYSRREKRKFARFCKENRVQAIRCDYIWYADLISRAVNDLGIFSFIQTHDIQSRFFEDQKKTQGRTKWYVKPQDEIDILNRFDRVLTIGKADYEYFKGKLKPGKIGYLPMVYPTHELDKKPDVHHLKIGFVGGKAFFNVEAASWFLEKVVPSLPSGVTFHVYGGVCSALTEAKNNKSVFLHGPFDNAEEVYRTCDLMVNPTFQSGGLKTKNVESLSYGVPVITTSVGARGIEDGVGKVVFQADEPDEYIRLISSIVDESVPLPDQKQCLRFVDENFGMSLLEGFHSDVIEMVNERKAKQ